MSSEVSNRRSEPDADWDLVEEAVAFAEHNSPVASCAASEALNRLRRREAQLLANIKDEAEERP